MCGNSFVRRANASIAIPIVFLVKNIIFLAVGIYTIVYVKNRYPDSGDFRPNRKIMKHSVIFFVTGYSFFWFIESSINLVLYQNCMSDNPKVSYTPLATTYNLLSVCECLLIFFVIFREKKNQRAFRIFLSRVFSKKREEK